VADIELAAPGFGETSEFGKFGFGFWETSEAADRPLFADLDFDSVAANSVSAATDFGFGVASDIVNPRFEAFDFVSGIVGFAAMGSGFGEVSDIEKASSGLEPFDFGFDFEFAASFEFAAQGSGPEEASEIVQAFDFAFDFDFDFGFGFAITRSVSGEASDVVNVDFAFDLTLDLIEASFDSSECLERPFRSSFAPWGLPHKRLLPPHHKPHNNSQCAQKRCISHARSSKDSTPPNTPEQRPSKGRGSRTRFRGS